MTSPLSSLVKMVKTETCGIKHRDCKCYLKYTNFEDDLIEYKCLCRKKDYQIKFSENLKKRLSSTYTISNHDIIRFIFLLQKGV